MRDKLFDKLKNAITKEYNNVYKCLYEHFIYGCL